MDTQGLPHAIHITTANVTDREGAIIMVTNSKERLSEVKNLLLDGVGAHPAASPRTLNRL